jgi:hypothetical protein
MMENEFRYVSPSEIQNRLESWRYVAEAIANGLRNNKPFSWTGNQFASYHKKALAMGITLVTKTELERDGYRLKRGVTPVGSGYFCAPTSYQADLYVLECQAAKIEKE